MKKNVFFFHSFSSILHKKEEKVKNMKFFSKEKEEKEEIFRENRLNYAKWREELQSLNKPFFMIPTDFKHLYLKDISGGAMKLFVFLGFHSKYATGESWYGLSEVAAFFGKDQRTVANWFQELEEIGLVFRGQQGFKMRANTFLQPYGFRFDEMIKDEDKGVNDVLVDLKASDNLGYKPKFGLLLNYAFQEFTLVICYQEEQLYHCSCFYNFNYNEINTLRKSLKGININIDIYDIESSVNSSKDKRLKVYNELMNYLDEASMLR